MSRSDILESSILLIWKTVNPIKKTKTEHDNTCQQNSILQELFFFKVNYLFC